MFDSIIHCIKLLYIVHDYNINSLFCSQMINIKISDYLKH